MLPGGERIEIGDALYPEHHGLALDDEVGFAVLQGALDDPWVALRVVLAVLAPGCQSLETY